MRPAHASDATLRRVTFAIVLTSPAFVAAVAVLIVNDWVLKPALGNWLSGKLSDIAGVFVLPLLLSAVLPSRRKAAFVLTALGFALWKSPLADAPLALWNSLGVWRLARVVDFTDWIALLALIPSYRLAAPHAHRALEPISAGRRLFALTSGLVALLALAADSVAPPRYPFPYIAAFTIPASGDDVLSGLVALGFIPDNVKAAPTSRALSRAADTLALYVRQPPERSVHIAVEMRKVSPTEVRLELLSASAFGPVPNAQSLEGAFEKQVVEPLRNWVAKHRTGER